MPTVAISPEQLAELKGELKLELTAEITAKVLAHLGAPAAGRPGATASEPVGTLNSGVFEFVRAVAVAKTQAAVEDRWVEAPLEVIQRFNPDGVGEAGYFWYEGVRVFEQGKREAIEKQEGKSVEQRTFGGKTA